MTSAPPPASPARRLHRRVGIVTAIAVLLTGAVAVIAPAGRADAYTTIYYNGAGSAPRISVIGDSTIAALRWTGRFEPLRRFNYVYDAESCRRTAIASCRGREGYTPENVLTTMRRLSGQLGQVLVLMAGYDDPGYGFASAVDAVMAEASRQGIPHVMWLTMRTADVSYVGPTYSSNTYTFRDNNRILLQKAQQYGGRLQVADWATYSATRSDWFYSDGIHLTLSGSDAAATFIANQAALVINGETVTPQPGAVPILPWVTIRAGDRGASVVTVQLALMERGYSVTGGADGVFGAVTTELVRRFQRANGLPVTGVVDAATAVKLGINNAGGTAAPAAWVDLRRGMGGTGVAAAQQALIAAGIWVRGGVDGVFSTYTVNAVKRFQVQQGLTATGVINAATAKALGLYSGTWIDLRRGMANAKVRQAQRALVNGGIALTGGVTGRFNEATYYAVRTFQRYQGLAITGVIDAATARALGLFTTPAPASVWSNLSNGASGTRVAMAQRALMSAGVFLRGGATGVFNMYTTYAVKRFQQSRGISATGVLDAVTARALGLFDGSNPSVGWQELRLGSYAAQVARVEAALVAAGIRIASGVNNTFGLDTYNAVRTFQRRRSLPVTGVVDYNTARALGLFTTATATPTLLMASVAPEVTDTSTTTTTTPTTTTTTSTTTTVPPVAVAEPTAGGPVTLGDLVWLDADGDGIQDPGEEGVADIELVLLDGSGVEQTRTTTDRWGAFELSASAGATYQIEITRIDGLVPSLARQGTDPELDSDLLLVDEVRNVWSTGPFVAGDETATGLDLGLVVAPEQTETTAPASAAPDTTSDEPVATEPLATEPAATEPVATEAPVTEPAGTEAPPTTAQPTTAPTTVAPTTVAPTTVATTVLVPAPSEPSG